MRTRKMIQDLLVAAAKRFNELDENMEIPLDTIKKALWIPWVALLLLGIFYIFYQVWWLPLLLVVGAVLWNAIAMLSFKRPRLIMPPRLTMEALVIHPFHFNAKSRRILFLILPFFLLGLVHEFRASLWSWSIALAFVALLRFILTYDRWVSEKYFDDKDYVALGLASALGFISFFWVCPGENPKLAKEKAKEQAVQQEEEKEKQSLGWLEENRETIEKRMKEFAEELNMLKQSQAQGRDRMGGLEKEDETLKQKTAKLEEENKALRQKTAKLEEENKALKSLDAIQTRLAKLESNEGLKALEETQEKILARIGKIEETGAGTAGKQLESINQEIGQLKTRTLALEDTSGRLSTLENDMRSLKVVIGTIPEIQSRILALENKPASPTGTAKIEERLAKAEERLAKVEESGRDFKVMENALQTLQMRLAALESENKALRVMEETQARILALENENRALKEQERTILKSLQQGQEQINTKVAGIEKDKEVIQLLQQAQIKMQLTISDVEREIRNLKQRLEEIEKKVR